MGNRRSLSSAILALTVLVPAFAGGSPVSAGHKKRCHGTGSMTLASGIAYFPTSTSNVGFNFSFQCFGGGTATGSGTFFVASCGRATGSGTSGGDPFTIEVVGTTYVITQGLEGAIGTLLPIPDTSTVPFGNSCSGGTARNFTMTGQGPCVEWHTGAACLH